MFEILKEVFSPRCFNSKNGQAAIYIEATDEKSFDRQVTEIDYDLQQLPKHYYGYDSSEGKIFILLKYTQQIDVYPHKQTLELSLDVSVSKIFTVNGRWRVIRILNTCLFFQNADPVPKKSWLISSARAIWVIIFNIL